MSRNTTITGIDVLDKLLGCNGSEGAADSAAPGSIMLIRGEPGSGKTTLGLQILSESLKKLPPEDQMKAAFFSLEGKPQDVLSDSQKRYGFFEDTMDCVRTLGTQQMELIIRYAAKCAKEDKELDPDELIEECRKYAQELSEGKIAKPIIDLCASFAGMIHDKLSDKNLQTRVSKDAGCEYHFVFIDSLNVLVQLIERAYPPHEIQERLILNSICASARDLFPNAIIIFTGEYHYRDPSKRSAVSESFFCDIEIALFAEPVVVPRNYDPKFESPLGSNALSLMTHAAKSIHTQSFCRVLKSRHTPNQSRRCAYDIVSGKGIEFYETYPGDGHLVLFNENPRQTDIWKTLFEQDLPVLYPALRYDNFDRSSLQRTSAAQRRFRYVPQRVDMYLASFDNYWVNWYSELCLKSNVAAKLQEELVGIADLSTNSELLGLLSDICANIANGEGFKEFQKTVQKKVAVFLKDIGSQVPSNLKESPKIAEKARRLAMLESESGEGREILESFVSGLLKVLTRDETPAGQGRDINRPCLQCLWCRTLIRELLDKLTEVAASEDAGNLRQAIVEGCKITLNRSADDKSNIELSPPYDKLRRLVMDVLSLSHKEKHCTNTPPGSVDDNNLEDFLEAKEALCWWRQRLQPYLWFFLVKYFLSSEPRCAEVLCRIKEAHPSEKQDLKQHLSHLKSPALQTYLDKVLFSEKASKLSEDLGEIVKQSISDGFFNESVSGSNAFELVKEHIAGDRQYMKWIVILACIFYDVVQRPARYRLIAPIPQNKLRLYGERKSEIISELEFHRLDAKRPIHRPERLFSLHDQNNYCSIPYDANIGFLVYRKDIYSDFVKSLKNEEKRQAYHSAILRLYTAQKQHISVASGKYLFDDKQKLVNAIDSLIQKTLSGHAPTTWEEIIAYFLIEKKHPSPNKVQADEYFLIESRAPDSFLSTLLEFIWSCGVNLRISPNYEITETPEKDTFGGILRAYYLMGLMFRNSIIPLNSTLDAHELSSMYGYPKNCPVAQNPNAAGKKNRRWVFMRHWYSTFVEILSARREDADNTNNGFLWEEGAELDIMRIPVSLSNYIEYGNAAWHISCWGDWHMAMLSGSENMELGVDLVNALMSSDRVCERAFANAAIPTVEAFYGRYGDTPCFRIAEREDVILPKWTYNDLRRKLFKHAKSRSQIFDYHHCMSEFHSVLEYVHLLGDESTDTVTYELSQEIVEQIKSHLEQGLSHIKSFRTRPFLLS